MKKCIIAVSLAVCTLFGADAKLFTGSWIVKNEGLTITFMGKDSVKFTSDGEESINGKGTFKYTDSELAAKLNNEGMLVDVVYTYKKNGETVKVTTKSLKINGEAAEFSKDPMTMVRPASKKKTTSKTTKKTTSKK